MPLFATPIQKYHDPKDETLLDTLVSQLKRSTVNSLHQNPEVDNRNRYKYPKPEAMLHVLARSSELSEDGEQKDTKRQIERLLNIRGADINVHFKQSRKDKKAGRSPLVEAVRAGNCRLALFFIEKGADVRLLYGNVFGEEEGAGYNVLHTAANRGYDEIIAAALAKVKGKNDRKKFVNQADANGWTPLHDAAKTGNLASVNLLIAAGANLQQKAGGSQRKPIEFALERLQNAEAKFDVSQPNTVQELQQATAIVAALAKADKAWQMTITHNDTTKPLWQFLVDLWQKLVNLCKKGGTFDEQLALSKLINDIVQNVGFNVFDAYAQGADPKIIPLLEIVHFMTAAATAPATQSASPNDLGSSSNTATKRSSANEVDTLAIQLVIFLGHEGVAWDQQIKTIATTQPLWEMALDIIGTGEVNVQLVSNIINSNVGLDAVEKYTSTKGYNGINTFVVGLKNSREAAEKEREERQVPKTEAERDAASTEVLNRGGVGTTFLDKRIQKAAVTEHQTAETNLHPL